VKPLRRWHSGRRRPVGQVTVSWTAPDPGGSPITGYTVTASPGGPSVTVGAAATSAVVTGLTNGTAYTFEVRAANAAGQGPAATTAPATPTASVVVEKVVRLAGADRYATAAEIARQFPAGLPVLYVASGQNFPDALAGAALAATRDAPVVLVRSGDIPSPTARALGELAPERIVILGGTASVSAGVETQLRAYATANTPDEVTRLQGADRYATAAAIARQFPSGVPVLYVASGQNFPDALAGAALAGLGGAPAVLVRTDDIPAATGTALTGLRAQRIVVLGGEVSVSAVASQLSAYVR